MIDIAVDTEEVKRICREKIEELIKDVEGEYVYWDSAELQRRTCMSWNFIQDTFFFDPRFPKRKVKSKWLFPVRETKKFLESWLMEQPTS